MTDRPCITCLGEVYRERDSRLSREVAIKVLPAELASDAGRLKRFETEAQAASALNHPNIVTIYGIGIRDSCSNIAMEPVGSKPAGASSGRSRDRGRSQSLHGSARSAPFGRTHRKVQ